jgi:hypothetical protein
MHDVATKLSDDPPSSRSVPRIILIQPLHSVCRRQEQQGETCNMQGGPSSGSYVAGLTAAACNYSPVERPLRCNRKTNCSQLQEVLLQSLSVSFVFLLVVQRFDRFLYISVGDVTIKTQQIEAYPTHLHACELHRNASCIIELCI